MVIPDSNGVATDVTPTVFLSGEDTRRVVDISSE